MKLPKCMTQEDKSLLLKDLCARLPYGVIVQDELGRVNKLVIGNADLIRLFYNDFSTYGESALSLPLLRPMSSITEEEKRDYNTIAMHTIVTSKGFVHLEASELVDWLNAHHFDYRGLIEKGLAIAVTEEINPYKD